VSTDTAPPGDRDALVARYESVCGPWATMYDPLLDADPALLDAFITLCEVPAARGHLEPKVREFVCLAASVSTTHLYEPAVQTHIRNALRLGADPMEIIEVIELTSVLGIHTCEMGMEALTEQIRAEGGEPVDFGEREQAVRAAFEAGRGMWPSMLEEVLRWDVDLLEAYLAYSTIPWKRGLLDAKVKEFIYIAIDASTTKLHVPGTTLHIANALKAGASYDEIVDVLETITRIGIHACTMAVPILLEELQRAGLSLA
jgi:alkylhydroperoxidase/carboxymuconolactone decarboxylase family protein YurZ